MQQLGGTLIVDMYFIKVDFPLPGSPLTQKRPFPFCNQLVRSTAGSSKAESKVCPSLLMICSRRRSLSGVRIDSMITNFRSGYLALPFLPNFHLNLSFQRILLQLSTSWRSVFQANTYREAPREFNLQRFVLNPQYIR